MEKKLKKNSGILIYDQIIRIIQANQTFVKLLYFRYYSYFRLVAMHSQWTGSRSCNSSPPQSFQKQGIDKRVISIFNQSISHTKMLYKGFFFDLFKFI